MNRELQGFNDFLENTDTGLINLSSRYVKPACLPSQTPAPGTKCYITGKLLRYFWECSLFLAYLLGVPCLFLSGLIFGKPLSD